MAVVLLPRSRVPALALAGWTLLTWVTRVPLFLADDELGVGDKALSALPVAVFVVLAAVTAAAVVRRSPRAGTAVRALAGWSLVYWAVRLPLILVNDHPVPFYVVHAALALTAGALSVLALVRLSAEGRCMLPGHGSADRRRGEALDRQPGHGALRDEPGAHRHGARALPGRDRGAG